MIPKKYDAHEYDYPDFQPDQVLSADNLNHSFAFNEQQERLTRTNLIGIGIVCGLRATRAADGKTVTITKGTGVTSSGYLIVQGKENSDDSIDYKKYRSFNSVQDIKYNLFVSGITARYTLWELLDIDNAKPEDPELTTSFLNDKVCLLFYEMLEVDAKNCDTTSCDDKGKTITVTVRKLLVDASKADKIIDESNGLAKSSGSGEVFPGISALTEIRLPKFDVLSTTLGTTDAIYEAYQKVFSKKLVESVGTALNDAFNLFKDYLKVTTNPFSNFNSTFAFLYDGSNTGNNLLHYQYFYDLFCDLLLAYNEWCHAASSLIAMCTPPEALFPRHLFLCNFAEAEGIEKSKYRNYFIPSPIIADHEQAYKEFKSLFQRLSRLISCRFIPSPQVVGTGLNDSNIRITPSVIGNYPIGARAIPYYYKPNEASNKLVDVWNYFLSGIGKQTHILSYNPSYNTTDDFVKTPLSYDLEAYNFFRIEGHIGKQMTSVIYNLEKLRSDNRLPFQYVALSVDGDDGIIDLNNVECCFQDLEAMYDTMAAELACRFYKLLLCLYMQPKYVRATKMDIAAPGVESRSSFSPKYAYGFSKNEPIPYTENSIGQSYEDLRSALKSSGRNSMAIINSYGSILKNVDNEVTPVEIESSSTLLSLVHTITSLRNGLTTGLSKINALEMLDLSTLLKRNLSNIKSNDSLVLLKNLFTENPCLNDLYDIVCEIFELMALIADYFKRVEELKIAATLKAFSIKNPGLEHKGGVPKGGTFIVVYRNAGTPAIDKGKEFLSKLKAADKEVIIAEKADVILADTNIKTKLQYRVFNKGKLLTDANTKNKVIELQKKGLTKGDIELELGLQLINLFQLGTFSNEIDSWKDGIVVADFYLPYACCCGCPPVQFVVNIPPPKVTVSLINQEYCNADIKEYAFNANPTEGKMTSSQQDSVKDNGDGTFSFVPSKVKVDAGNKDVTVNFTYTFEGQMQTMSVKVYSMPNVKIVAQADAVNPLKVQFTFDKPALISGATWDFGDTKTSVELAPSHLFTKGGDYKISAVVKNGLCTFTPELLTLTVNDPAPIVITTLPTQICKTADFLNFTITPKGGTYSGEGFKETVTGSGNFVFSPASVFMNGLLNKTVTLNYTAPAGNSATANIVVYEQPVGNKTINVTGISGTAAQFVFTGLANTSKIELDFGDSSAKGVFDVNNLSTFATGSHHFPGNGPFTVKATLINGTCRTVLDQRQVSFKAAPEVLKVCQLLSVPVTNYKELKPKLDNTDFIKLYTQLRLNDIDTFFRALTEQLSVSPNVPLSFFAQHSFKVGWISALPLTNANNRALSIQLLAIFSDIVTTISCLKADDINAGSIKTGPFLGAIIIKIKELNKLTATDKTNIKPLVDDSVDERHRIDSNQEAGIKKEFIKALDEIQKVIESIS
jgi:hypothetical protein